MATGKPGIYEAINAYVKKKTGRKIGVIGGRRIFDIVTELMFSEAVTKGSFRFNRGYGTFSLREYKPGKRVVPIGNERKLVVFGHRKKVRYEEGVMTEDLVKTGGDLEKAKRIHNQVVSKEIDLE